MINNTSKIFKDTFIVMAANVINYAGMFVIAVMISRILGVDALGEFTYIIAVSSIIAIVSELGLSQLLIRKINENRPEVFSLIKNVNTFKLQLSAIVAVISIGILFVFQKNSFSAALVIGIVTVIPKALYSTYDASIRALQKQSIPSAIKSANTFIQITAVYFILLYTKSLLNLFILIFFAELLTVGVFYFFNKSLWKKSGIVYAGSASYRYSAVKPVIKEALPFFGSGAFALSIPRVIMIILENLTGAASLGIFSAASRFANGIGLLSGALYNTFYPAMTDPTVIAAQRKKLTIKFSAIGFSAGLVIALIIYFSADILIQLTFKIPEAVPVLKLLGFAVIPILTYSVIQPYLISMGKEKFILKLYLFVFLFSIPLTVFIIHHHGLTGAAFISVFIEYLILSVLYFKFLRVK